jgi:hypothetical protein
MKKQFITIALACSFVTGVMGQGSVIFDNLTTGNPTTDPKIFNTDGVTGLDDTFVAQLWGGVDASSIQPLGSTLTFFSAASGGAGFVNGSTGADRTVAGVLAGEVATFVIQTWRPTDGATFAEAQATAGAIWGQSQSFTQTLGGTPASGPPIAASKLTNLQSFSSQMTPVPEPSVILLGLAGAGLLWARRKQ